MAERVLVTGISGFIAKHVALKLLLKGYEVCGTIRALNKAEQVRDSLAKAGADTTGLTFAAADLTKDEGWENAAAGCVGVMHVASPFPMSQPRERMALVPAAREGALRVLKAGKKADRIVMTSSLAAMMYRAGRPAEFSVTEEDWTDPDWRALSPYVISKTLAERAAWDFAAEEGFRHRLTTVNPGLVAGPALDDDVGASVELVRLMVKGEYPAVPPASYPTVDVRDVAAIHVAALETPEAGGRRLIAAKDTVSLLDIANIIRETAPEIAAKVPRRELPVFLVRIAALFDRRVAAVIPDLGAVPKVESDYVTALTGVSFRSAREAIAATAQSLADIKAV